MMKNLESKFEEYLVSSKLIRKGQSVLLAVSGGVDSMVMLCLFSKIQKRLKLNLSVIHINHQLRGLESDEDEQFVKQKSAYYGIPYNSERVDVLNYMDKYKLSKQMAARELRYKCFEEVRKRTKSNVVATAHNADDNAETVMLNILRGSGIHGLAGIQQKRDIRKIIRPLLFALRTEIEAYSKINCIMFRNDSSNDSDVYRRNELRLKVFPVLKSKSPDIVNKLNEVAKLMSDVSQKLEKLVGAKFSSILKKDSQSSQRLNLKKLNAEADFLQNEILLEILNRTGVEPTEIKIEMLRKLCALPTGRMVELSNAWMAHRNRDYIVFEKSKVIIENKKIIDFGNTYNFNGFNVSVGEPESAPNGFTGAKNVEYVDAEKLKGQLILRYWNSGDWFIPLGMKAKKKLSDYFIDQKIPRYLKAFIPVLESDGNIVWICGKRLDDRFKLTEKTKKAVKLKYQPVL